MIYAFLNSSKCYEIGYFIHNNKHNDKFFIIQNFDLIKIFNFESEFLQNHDIIKSRFLIMNLYK